MNKKQRFTLNEHIVCGDMLKDCIEQIETMHTRILNSFPASENHIRSTLGALQSARKKMILASSEMEEVMLDDFHDSYEAMNAYFGPRMSGHGQ